MEKLAKILIALLLTLFVGNGFCQSSDVTAKVAISKKSIAIGDWVELKIKVEEKGNKGIKWPIINDSLTSNIEILKASKIDTIKKDGSTFFEQTLTITSYDSGYHAIPPFDFMFDIKSDSVFSLAQTQALLLAVTTINVDTTAKFKDIKPVIDEPLTILDFLPYIFLVVGVLSIIIVVVYFYLRYKSNKPLFSLPKKQELPADIIAIEGLNKLKEKKLWQNGQTKQYYTELTDIIRYYIEKRFEFPAMEMVTSEIVGCMKSNVNDEALVNDSRYYLEMADNVKFAKFETLPDENHAIMNWAFDFVEKTKRLSKPLDINS